MRKVNRFKKVVAAVLVLTMAVGMFPAVTSAELSETGNQTYLTRRANYERSALIDAFGIGFIDNHERAMENLHTIRSAFLADSMGVHRVPTFYGGSYIDCYGNLTTLLVWSYIYNEQMRGAGVSESESLSTILSLATRRNNGFNIRFVEFSQNELFAMGNFIFDFRHDNPDCIAVHNVSGWHLDTMQNRIVVDLIDNTEMMQTLFRKTVSDSPMIVFEDCPLPPYYDSATAFCLGEPFDADDFDLFEEMLRLADAVPMPNTPTITLVPGQRIYVHPADGGSTREFSLGFGVFSSNHNANGFVTSLHGRAPVGSRVSLFSNSMFIGEVAECLVLRDDRYRYDAAFVRVNSDVIVSRNFATGGGQHQLDVFFPIGGQLVRAHGASTQADTGTLPFGTVGPVGVWAGEAGFVAAVRPAPGSALGRGGDSGGIVVSIDENMPRDRYIVLGIVQGGFPRTHDRWPNYWRFARAWDFSCGWSSFGLNLGFWR